MMLVKYFMLFVVISDFKFINISLANFFLPFFIQMNKELFQRLNIDAVITSCKHSIYKT